MGEQTVGKARERVLQWFAGSSMRQPVKDVKAFEDAIRAEALREREAEVERLVELLVKCAQDVIAPIAAIQCRCDVAWTARGRHEPNEFHADYEDVIEAARELRSAIRTGIGHE